MPMVHRYDQQAFRTIEQFMADTQAAISALEQRVEALEKQNALLEQLVSRHSDLAPRCDYCGHTAIRLDGQWAQLHSPECPHIRHLPQFKDLRS